MWPATELSSIRCGNRRTSRYFEFLPRQRWGEKCALEAAHPIHPNESNFPLVPGGAVFREHLESALAKE